MTNQEKRLCYQLGKPPDKGTTHLVHSSKACCITVEECFVTKQASKVTASRDYLCEDLGIASILKLPRATWEECIDKYLLNNEIAKVLDPYVLPASTVKESFDGIKNSINEIVYGSVG